MTARRDRHLPKAINTGRADADDPSVGSVLAIWTTPDQHPTEDIP